MATQVKGYFHDKEKVAQAVDRLLRDKIPQDQIRVTVEDDSGTELREIPVKERMGALRGAAWGALGGAAFGALAVLFLGMGSFSWVGLDPLGGGLAMGVFRGMVAGAVAGVPIGGVLGMGDWKGAEELSEEELSQGAVVVAVRGEGLVERARSALESAGPERVGS